MAPRLQPRSRWSQTVTDMTPSIRRDGEAVSPRTHPTITPPRDDQLTMNGEAPTSREGGEERTFFCLLYRPTPQLGKDNAELAFVVDAGGSHPYDIYTRAGSREGVSQETWEAVYEPHAQPVDVPQIVETLTLSTHEQGGDISALLRRLHPQSSFWAQQSDALDGGGNTHV